jgi:hypothetical protein
MVGRKPRVKEVSCRPAGRLAGVGTDYTCYLEVYPGVAQDVCAAVFHGGAITCHSVEVYCPRYTPPSTKRGSVQFTLPRKRWSLSFPRRFSVYHCLGLSLQNTGYTEVGVSNFNAHAGSFNQAWPKRNLLPRGGVFLIVGTYDSGLDISPHPDTRFPLTLKRFHHSFALHPGIAQEVWSHGDRYSVQIYLGPKATQSDRAAIRAVLHSLRLG